MNNSRLFPLIENPMGAAFSASRKRFEVVAAGRRSGKTERGIRKMIERAVLGSDHIDPRYGLFAPTQQQAKAIFWNNLKQMIPTAFIIEKSETELSIKLFNNSEIIVAGLDKPQRIEGRPWNGFLITEFDDVRAEAWGEHLRPCLSDRNGFAILEGVPEGKAFLYECALKAKTDPDWAFFSWPSREVIDEKEIQSAMRDLDPRTFRQEYEASFEDAAGRPYYAFTEENLKPAPQEFINNREWKVGIDFNVVPYMPAVAFSIIGDTLWFVDEIKMPNGNTPAMIEEMKRKWGQKVREVYPDPAGRHRTTSAEVGRSDFICLQNAGYEVLAKDSTKSVKDRTASANARFCNAKNERRAFVDLKRCPGLADALLRHGYKKGTMQPENDEFIHFCDAACYPMDFIYPTGVRLSGYGRMAA